MVSETIAVNSPFPSFSKISASSAVEVWGLRFPITALDFSFCAFASFCCFSNFFMRFSFSSTCFESSAVSFSYLLFFDSASVKRSFVSKRDFLYLAFSASISFKRSSASARRSFVSSEKSSSRIFSTSLWRSDSLILLSTSPIRNKCVRTNSESTFVSSCSPIFRPSLINHNLL